jgi:hypothetical protein
MTKSYKQIEFIVLYKCDCGGFHRDINQRIFDCRQDAMSAAKKRMKITSAHSASVLGSPSKL